MENLVNQLVSFFTPEHYDLMLDIDRVARRFNGVVKIRGTQIGDEIRLHSKDLLISHVTINGVETEVKKYENDEIGLVNCIENNLLRSGEVEVEIEFASEIADGSMHGLYPCYYKLDGEKKELLATQFESHHAREVFPCVDEPAAKATFDLTLITETGVEVLSNMPIALQGTTLQEKDRMTTKFVTTPKMSTYLLAFVIGNLQKKTTYTKSGVEVNIYATPAQKPQSLDFALDTAVRCIDFYDEYFDIKYPLPKSDHVALPDFGSGAMENWGLITYREMCLLADENTGLASRQYIATVIAHELSHQWFGNLVTMKWWDDLWLNESFASLCEHITTDVLFPDWQMWFGFETADVFSALQRDALPGVQAVRQSVHHPAEIQTLFDPAIVYAKGERLLKMCRALIGEDNFRTGLQNYFKKFAYQNTEANDLWTCFSESSNQDIAGLMNPWLTQPGYPLIIAELTDEKITLKQERFFLVGGSDNTIWPIPLFSNDENAPQLMVGREAVFVPAEQSTFQLNRGNNGHFLTAFNPELRAKIDINLAELDTVERLTTLNQAMLLARAGRSSTADALDLLNNLRDEKSWAVWDTMSLFIADLKMFVENNHEAEEQLKKLIGELARPLYETLGLQSKITDTLNEIKLRPTIISHMVYAEDRATIDACLTEFSAHRHNLAVINGDLRPVILTAVVKFNGQETFDYLLDIYQSITDADLKQDICTGLTAARAADQIDQLIHQITLTDIVRPQDLFYWFARLLGNRYARAKAWAWCRDQWPWIEKTFGGDKSFDMFPRYAGTCLRTMTELSEFDEFFADKKSDPALARAITIGHTDIAARADWLERDRAGVLGKLNS
ncbi:M1 family metallopeptidase [Candidatus Saccharibacteria bacterium]|nr:M1 family metallopeptidase [Candidatus Saccharibacteria bacterium]